MYNIEYADANAIEALERPVKHILLLHETDLSALFIGDLVDELRARGWEIISNQEAYTDEISKFELEASYPYNPGRIGEIILQSGKQKWDRPDTLTEKGLDSLFQQTVLK
jgi:hypothetical protein